MKPRTRNALPLLTLVVPTVMALWFAQYLIESFCPEITLMDLGAFYAIGLVSGLATGVWLARSRRGEGWA